MMTIVRTIQVLVKLLPSIFALRRDRKKWINHGVRGVRHGRRYLENLRHPHPAGRRLGGLTGQLGQLAQRFVHRPKITDEDQQLTGAHHASQHAIDSDVQYDTQP